MPEPPPAAMQAARQETACRETASRETTRQEIGRQETARRMRAIAAELAAAGLTTHLHESAEYVDVTATLSPPGQREVEAIVDDDGYVELRFWHAAADSPGQVSALISNAMTVIAMAAGG